LSSDDELTFAGLCRAAKVETYQPPERATGDTCTTNDLVGLADAGSQFAAIYADPPWTFRVYSGKGKARSAERHYKTMSQDEMKDPRVIPVERLAADNAALFMWAVMPQLPEALALIEAWGFTYKTCAFTWAKTYPGKVGTFAVGMGYWTRSNAELCLLATRGSPKRIHKDVRQLVIAPRGAHSSKPEIVSERIERLVCGPYLELFARRPRDGWTVWGNEIERNLFHNGAAK
jgi:N6-adenosine-specific RNA methylase IME4